MKKRAYIKIGIAGPVGSGKTALIERLSRAMMSNYSIAVITNDIYTKEDAEFLTREAARADRVTEERNYYYDRYEDARRLLQGENAGQHGEVQNSKPIP